MKKKLLSVVMAAVMIMSLAGCGNSSGAGGQDTGTANTESGTANTETAADTAEAPAGTKELKKIKIANNPFIGVAPVYIAKDMGIFEKYGLDVELVSFNDSSESTAALVSGNVDIAGSTLDAALIMADQYRDQMPQVVCIRDDSAGADGIVAVNGIDSINDLKGKTIGVAINQTTHYLLQQALEKAGIDESEVKLVDMSSSDAGSSFISGNIEVAVTWEPYLSNAANSGIGKVIFSSKDAPGSIMDVMMVSKKTADAKEAWVSDAIAAMEEARLAMFDPATKDEAMEIASKYLEVSAADTEAMLPTVKLYTNEEGIEAINQDGLAYGVVNKVSDFYVERGIMKAVVDPADVLDPYFVENAKLK